VVKLIIQIPCYNEEETLPMVMRDIPKTLPGVDVIETLVIDDGSRDRTVAVAHELGVTYVIRHVGNKGLAAAFQTGLNACLRRGADVIVNTDGDNQYPQQEIGNLIAPILRHEADMVIGNRQVQQIEHFSPLKKQLQKFGSWVVRRVSNTNVPDAVSGFRAFSREAALQLNVITNYTYTTETIIQAGKKNLAIADIPIITNEVTRPSRLMRSTSDFLKKQISTIVRIYTLYEPFKIFSYFSFAFLLIGGFYIGRFAYWYFFNHPESDRHLQSTIFGTTAFMLGIIIFLFGLLADVTAANRRITEEVLYRSKRAELEVQKLREDLAASRGELLAAIQQQHTPPATPPAANGSTAESSRQPFERITTGEWERPRELARRWGRPGPAVSYLPIHDSSTNRRAKPLAALLPTCCTPSPTLHLL